MGPLNIHEILEILFVRITGITTGVLRMFLGVPVLAIVVMFFEGLIRRMLAKKVLSMEDGERVPKTRGLNSLQ